MCAAGAIMVDFREAGSFSAALSRVCSALGVPVVGDCSYKGIAIRFG